MIDLGRPQEFPAEPHELMPIQTGVGKRHFYPAQQRPRALSSVTNSMAYGLQYSRDSLRVEFIREHRLIPRRRHERHGGQVVELGAAHIVNASNDAEDLVAFVEQQFGKVRAILTGECR